MRYIDRASRIARRDLFLAGMTFCTYFSHYSCRLFCEFVVGWVGRCRLSSLPAMVSGSRCPGAVRSLSREADMTWASLQCLQATDENCRDLIITGTTLFRRSSVGPSRSDGLPACQSQSVAWPAPERGQCRARTSWCETLTWKAWTDEHFKRRCCISIVSLFTLVNAFLYAFVIDTTTSFTHLSTN